MTYAVPILDSRSKVTAYGEPATAKAPPRRGFLGRLFDSIFESRERAAERSVGSYLARTGYKFTDSIEREINARQFSGDWNTRR